MEKKFIILLTILMFWIIPNIHADYVTDELLIQGKDLVESAIKNAQSNTSKYLGEIQEQELKLKEFGDIIKELRDKQENFIVKIREEEDKIKKLNEKPKEIHYSVIKGDCLWNIAKRSDIYGDPYKWVKIHNYNKDQIKNPDLIYPGQVFRIPLGPVDESDMPTRYEVMKGDSLWKIAGYEKIYGDPYKWPVIYKANKNQINDPNLIYPYQVLQIPRQLSKAY